jgi:hypothetical protein
VRKSLIEVRPTIAEYIDPEDGGVHELLDLAFQELELEGVRFLAVLDGFDHVKVGTELTRTLLDQLLSLARKTSLVLVTGSRRPLRALCKTEESLSSDFWEIFYDTPIYVGHFDDGDWESLLAPFAVAGVSLDSSARKEIVNWSGGVPVLVSALLQELSERDTGGTFFSKADVDTAAEATLEGRRQLLAALWEDCNGDLQNDMASLVQGDIALGDLSDGRRRALETRGFGQVSGNRMRSSCRLMARFATQQAPAIADLKRLFAKVDGFERNIPNLLGLRFGQVSHSGMDKDLREYVESAIREIERNPELALKLIRSIATRALTLVWQAELPPDQTIPDVWIEEWSKRIELPISLKEKGGLGKRRLPPKPGAQCNLLRLITGAENIRPVARFVTKPTYLLIDL